MNRFMTAMSPSGYLGTVLNARATPKDMLKAYFQCVVFWEKVCTRGWRVFVVVDFVVCAGW